jgi:excisionase family DNA binding protein
MIQLWNWSEKAENALEPTVKVMKSFCTTREAAQILGVSVRTAQLWTEDGLLQAWKTDGGHRRISRQSVEKLLAVKPEASQDKNGQTGLAGAPASHRMTILVVDDEHSVLRLYERQMGRWPMKPSVVTARNGIEALVRLGMTRPDMLVTDLRMPDMDGFQMLARLRALPELADLTTVVVSGLDRKEIEQHGGVPAGVPVLPKPIPFDRLLDIATVVADRKLRASSQIAA